ncbi:unnamed protein product [Caenorhabditis bovis]|uniref:Abnormal cell migration protein 18-like fibronectin type I domain-containing protein n=1 Tax=Caenorhabditis bovis TaxID=2654633 RepID=A0A8S1EGG7_9PELO|nr:unnamed protein product [Caenorhabditis bovis]
MLFVWALLASAALLVDANANKCTYDGQEIEAGKTVTVRNSFRIKCIAENNGGWSTTIVGCVTPDGQEIEIGQNSTGDRVFECKKNDAGQVMLQEIRSARTTCQSGHKIGEEWVEKSFKHKCGPEGVTEISGCVVGDDKTFIALGSTSVIRGVEYECKKNDDNSVAFQATGRCVTKENEFKNNGDEYRDGNFMRQCDNGVGKIIGCAADGVSDTIPIGKNVTVGDQIYSCLKENDKILFKKYSTNPNLTNVYAQCSHQGKLYSNGSTFIVQNAFRVRCVTFPNLTATLETISCITPAGVEIPIGTKLEEGDRVLECTAGNVSLKSWPGKSSNCQGVHKLGEEWVEGSFKLRCEPYGKTNLTACLTKSGVEIPLGSSQKLPEGYTMECVSVDGQVILRQAAASECTASNGQTKKIDETWVEGNFVRKCSQYGIALITACHVDGFGEIPLNRNATSGNHVYMCGKDGDKYSFNTGRTL